MSSKSSSYIYPSSHNVKAHISEFEKYLCFDSKGKMNVKKKWLEWKRTKMLYKRLASNICKNIKQLYQHSYFVSSYAIPQITNRTIQTSNQEKFLSRQIFNLLNVFWFFSSFFIWLIFFFISINKQSRVLQA